MRSISSVSNGCIVSNVITIGSVSAVYEALVV